ncbi:MAG: hypothetical protein ACM3VT_12465 [Solirubrobacterales bacterium]
MKGTKANDRAAVDIPETPSFSSGISELLEETERICPECGAAMIEFDRLVQDGAIFTWYACSHEDCTGQWLTKKVLRMCGA